MLSYDIALRYATSSFQAAINIWIYVKSLQIKTLEQDRTSWCTNYRKVDIKI